MANVIFCVLQSLVYVWQSEKAGRLNGKCYEFTETHYFPYRRSARLSVVVSVFIKISSEWHLFEAHDGGAHNHLRSPDPGWLAYLIIIVGCVHFNITL